MSQRIRTPTLHWLERPVVVISLLCVYFVLTLWSLAKKSPTFDELGHVTAGYSYWIRNDYRLDPENGNLPKRIFALPLLIGNVNFPPENSKWWRETDDRFLADEWFYRSGFDPDVITGRGRAMGAVIAVIGGMLVWVWSSRLFGPSRLLKNHRF